MKSPSWLQIKKNYENAIYKAGGKKIFSDGNNASYKISKDGKETYVQLVLNSGEELAVDQFYLDILEKEAMKQEIEASVMLKEIAEKGYIALYINFETGKSDIKPESQKTVDEIAEMLKANAAMKISVEGHTDDVGTPAANKILSEKRAQSIMAYLVTKGIDKTRLTAKGWGQEKPIADNRTEDGKGKNRRVEIVKM